MTASNLSSWISEHTFYCANAVERAISATHLTRCRPSFGQLVKPVLGSVLASPEIADWDPEPDYFFHWLRDSAIVMRVVADLMADAPDVGQRRRWQQHFQNFVEFSLGLGRLDGGRWLESSAHRKATRRGFHRFLRDDSEIGNLTGERLLGEPRFNPDGTIDFFRWSRPQYDGPALRALACLRYVAAGGPSSDALTSLVVDDLEFTVRHADHPCIGPWEEAGQIAHHYYVALVQLGALVQGRAWIGDAGSEAETRLRAGLDRHWSEPHQVYSAIRGADTETPDDVIDAATLLAVLDADLPGGPHSVHDPRVQATQAALEAMFGREFPINRHRPAGRGPALGRSRNDSYFGGGAWYPTTLAAASLYYRLARDGGPQRERDVRRGDSFMATVRDLTPDDGSMSEQVDRATGRPTSARHLTWSYAAFIEAARLRSQALAVRPSTP